MLFKLVLNLCTQAILQSYTPELLGLHIHSAMPSFTAQLLFRYLVSNSVWNT